MQHRRDTGLLHERICDPLECLGIERVTVRLRLGRRGAHRFGAFLELDPDTLRVDRILVPVPGKALDADSSDVAAETAEALEQGDRNSGPGRADRCGQSAGSRSDHEDVGLVDDLDVTRRLFDFHWNYYLRLPANRPSLRARRERA